MHIPSTLYCKVRGYSLFMAWGGGNKQFWMHRRFFTAHPIRRIIFSRSSHWRSTCLQPSQMNNYFANLLIEWICLRLTFRKILPNRLCKILWLIVVIIFLAKIINIRTFATRILCHTPYDIMIFHDTPIWLLKIS